MRNQSYHKSHMIKLLSFSMFFALAFFLCQQPVQAAADSYKAVFTGQSHSLAIKTDNSLWAWGYNGFGQLGNGTTTNLSKPAKIMDNVVTAAAGTYHSMAIKTDGSLWIWGSIAGEVRTATAHGGIRPQYISFTPVKIMENVSSISASYDCSLAVRTDGSLWGWGDNSRGQLGDGTTETRTEPVKIMEDVARASISNASGYAVKTDGSLWAWGRNHVGQLGDGTKEDRLNPIKVMDDVEVVASQISTGFAIKTDGTLWAWGGGHRGGASRLLDQPNPEIVLDEVSSVNVGESHVLVIRYDGSLWGWGTNQFGELGDGTSADLIRTPERISEGFTTVAAGDSRTFAVKADGSLWFWGRSIESVWNVFGPGEASSLTPVQISDSAAVMENSSAPAQLPSFSQDISVSIDGRAINTDKLAIMENGRILVPLRHVAEALGADIEWNADSYTATFTRAGDTVKLTIGSTVAQINGVDTNIDTPAMIVNQRTLIPVRFVAEAFAQKVEWDEPNRTVKISEDMSFAANSNLTQWFLGTGAIIAGVNKEAGRDPYLIGMTPRTAQYVNSERDALRNSWGIYDRESLISGVISIAMNGHSTSFDMDVQIFRSLSPEEQAVLLANAQGMDKYMWPLVLSLDEKWGDKSIVAWDWFRAGHLCRWGYVAGYITLQEAYELFEPVAVALRETFSSWDEATDNYLDGYAYWGRIDVSSTPNDYANRYKIYMDLKAAEKSDVRGLLFDPKVWQEPVRGVMHNP